MAEALPESDDRVREMRRCLEVIRDHNRESFDAKTSLETLRILETMHANIVKAPTELKFRRVRLTNPKVAKLIGTKGVQPFLVKMGWRARVEQMEEVWILDGDSFVLPLVRTTLLVLKRLADHDEEEVATAERQRADKLLKTNLERRLELLEVSADHERRKERFPKLAAPTQASEDSTKPEHAVAPASADPEVPADAPLAQPSPPASVLTHRKR